MPEKRTANIGLRISESLKDKLSLIAELETRSLSQQVEHFVKKGVDEYQRQHPEQTSEKK